VFEREPTRGVEEVGELARSGDQPGGDVHRGDEMFARPWSGGARVQRSVFRLGEPGDGDLVDVLQREAAHSVEKEGEVARRNHQGGEDVHGVDEGLQKVLGVADDEAVFQDGVAAVVGSGGETEARIAAGAGEDRGSEEGRFPAVEGRGRDGSGRFLETLALAEDGPAPFGSRSTCQGPAVSAAGAVTGSSRPASQARNSGAKTRPGGSCGGEGGWEGGGGVAAVPAEGREMRRGTRVVSCGAAFMELLTP
jgi:hypothetical protein